MNYPIHIPPYVKNMNEVPYNISYKIQNIYHNLSFKVWEVTSRDDIHKIFIDQPAIDQGAAAGHAG